MKPLQLSFSLLLLFSGYGAYAQVEEDTVRTRRVASVAYAAVPSEGVCGAEGDNVVYSYDADTKVLTLTGHGAMADFPKDEYGGYRAPWADVSGIYHVVVGEGITRIGEGNFNVWGLETVSLPSTLKVIGARAFSGCRMLGSVDLPAALERIETGAFSGCASMKEARLLGGVKVIGPEAFQDCISLASIDMPVSLDSIGSKAFAYCALTEVSVPEGLACVGDSVFYRCPLGHAVYSNTHFISFTPMAYKAYRDEGGNADVYEIPNGITTVCGAAFSSFGGVTDGMSVMEIPASVTTLRPMAFSDCDALTHMAIPETVTIIGDGLFSGCSLLETVELPQGMTAIGDEMFAHCESLAEIELPSQVTRIGANAFYSCWTLTHVSLPENLVEIGDRAFEYCLYLTDVQIPERVEHVGWLAFNNTNVAEPLHNSWLFVKLPSNYQGDYTMPEGITAISPSAFYYTPNLRGVYLPSSLQEIGDFAFCGAGCSQIYKLDAVKRIGRYAFANSGLTRLNWPKEVTVIEEGAFQNSLLQEFDIPGHVTKVGRNAFAYTSVLSDVFIPSSVQEWGTDAFAYSGLRKITFDRGVASLSAGMFSNCDVLQQAYCQDIVPPLSEADSFIGMAVYGDAVLYVPAGSVEAYRNSTGWGQFVNVQEFGSLIRVVKNIENAGRIDGMQQYQTGMKAALEAIPAYGYEFDEWKEDSGRGITLKPAYEFTVKGARTLVALFKPVLNENGVRAQEDGNSLRVSWSSEDSAASYLLTVYSDEDMEDEVESRLLTAADVDKDGRLSANLEGIEDWRSCYYSLVVTDGGSTTLSHYIGTLAHAVTGIGEMMGNAPFRCLAVDEGILLLDAEGQTAEVFDVQGRLQYSLRINTPRCVVPTEQGLYLVRVGERLFKILIR